MDVTNVNKSPKAEILLMCAGMGPTLLTIELPMRLVQLGSKSKRPQVKTAPSQIGPKKSQNGPQKSQNGPTVILRSQIGPKISQIGPNISQNGPKKSQNGPTFLNVNSYLFKFAALVNDQLIIIWDAKVYKVIYLILL